MYDTMPNIKLREATMCIGQACTMGSLLLAAGATGMRRALPNSRTAARASVRRVVGWTGWDCSQVRTRNYDTSPYFDAYFKRYNMHMHRTLLS